MPVGEIPSESSAEQRLVDKSVLTLFKQFHTRISSTWGDDENSPAAITEGSSSSSRAAFQLESHIRYLTNNTPLPKAFISLESSSVWIVYWRLHSLAILGRLDEFLNQSNNKDRILNYLQSAQSSTGGFGGAPHWLPHVSTTYAACAVVCMINSQDAWDIVDR
eukprot:Gregarina_sp_Poly_1__6187@NODE_3275_length_1218_cov_77_532580_g2079_i0_p1_GENE_NODE_3275_length_1218_cov_77_532580_g2079_i0NODE_3275_length_1218_cov_77_532580_g2079_i0_p1_ORF_typecomplete_len163_score13_97Prenyltrans/PF00432_21/1_2e03Prenyltrans/PF00432_21/7_8e03Prenyltrans/PF00432_21/4_2e07SQHop_cyclase_N/PF13249_6/0_033SQHop_cyclase_C/PF13243_6/0_036_NODE_3275_length_1218_cov_77_532580_g2079_i0449937